MRKAMRYDAPARGLVIAMLTLLLAGAGEARAQNLSFTVPDLDFINDGDTFSDGDPYVEINDFQRSRYPGLRARLFWGTKEELPLRPYQVVDVQGPGGAADRCYIYDSTLLRLDFTSTEIYLRGVPSNGSRWVVVFEHGPWKNGPIKLSSSAVKEYFQRGFEFAVRRTERRPWNPLSSALNIFRPQPSQTAGHFSGQTQRERNAEQRIAARRAAVAQEARAPVCVWFRRTEGRFLIAEQKPCACSG